MVRLIQTSLILLLMAARAIAESTLVVELPDGLKVSSASAQSPTLKLETSGKIDGKSITFPNLLPETVYNVRLTLADGTVFQGVDLSWYALDPPRDNAEPFDADDHKSITQIVKDVQAFENKKEIILYRGDHDRCTTLVQLIRDNGFYGDKGGEVIYRMELWYFKNQNGGWERIKQVSKVLQRDRFSKKDFDAALKIKWTPELGGIKLQKDQKKTIPFSGKPAGNKLPERKKEEAEEHD